MTEPTTLHLAAEATRQAGSLLSAEARLARAEVEAGIRRIVSGLVLCAIGGVLAMAGAGLLPVAAILGLIAAGLPPWAAVLAAAAAALCAAVLALTLGRARLRLSALFPRRSLDRLRHDLSLIRKVFQDEQAQQTPRDGRGDDGHAG